MCRRVAGRCPEEITAQVEHARIDQGTVGEVGPLQLVASQVEHSLFPLVDRVILRGGTEMPSGSTAGLREGGSAAFDTNRGS